MPQDRILGRIYEQNFSPPFPAYTSGHATFGCAAFKTVANFYGTTDIGFSYTGVEWNGETKDQFNRVRPCLERSFTDLLTPMAENAASRIFNGVHWVFDGTKGCEAGLAISDHVFENVFKQQKTFKSKFRRGERRGNRNHAGQGENIFKHGTRRFQPVSLVIDEDSVLGQILDITKNTCTENCDAPDTCTLPQPYPYRVTSRAVCPK